MLATTCLECGAPVIDDCDCRLMLATVTGWEWSDPALGAKHFLIVASYNLQHSAQFTDDAIGSLQSAFIEHMDNGLSVEQIRRRHAKFFGGRSPVLKPKADRRPTLRRWPMTIADVYAKGRLGAADRVVVWAQAVRSFL